MVLRLAVAAALLGLAGVVAAVLERRRPAPPPRDAYPVPRQLDRADFRRPEASWLVVVFSSRTCDSCATVVPKVVAMESDEVATDDVEFSTRRDLHERYRIEGVPTTVVADAEGVVRAAFVGNVTATDLWAAVAEVREPGSTPEHGLGAV